MAHCKLSPTIHARNTSTLAAFEGAGSSLIKTSWQNGNDPHLPCEAHPQPSCQFPPFRATSRYPSQMGFSALQCGFVSKPVLQQRFCNSKPFCCKTLTDR